MDNPYKAAPRRAFWKRAVSSGWSAAEVVTGGCLVRQGDKIASAGSCFAANIVPFLERAGFPYVRIDEYGKALAESRQDNFGYAVFSARYGNVYTPRQAVQLLQRALGAFKPLEDRWRLSDGLIVDPFRPGLKYPASSEREFELLLAQHLHNVIEVFRQADVFILTPGLTEAWISTLDGAVFPACPGTIAGSFDPGRHAFRSFSAREVTEDLCAFIDLARGINPRLRFILTVSPVPLAATGTDEHVLPATVYSKAVLRVAAGEVATSRHGVRYFPAYEIVTGPQAPHDFFESDRRTPSARAIREVMRAFLAHCETAYEVPADDRDGSSLPSSVEPPEDQARRLSRLVTDAQCEEEAAGL
jgi:GSCFA family protein